MAANLVELDDKWETTMTTVRGRLDHAGFLAIKEQLTKALAEAFYQKLVEMGDDVRGISWFCTSAKTHPLNALSKAA